MKRILLCALAIAGSISWATAQRYDQIKNLILLNQHAKAKEELDKNWSNAKFVAKPEAYILKATLLSVIGNDPEKKEAGYVLIKEADAVYKEYLEKDPANTLVMDDVYRNAPVNIYYSLFNQGIGNYNEKKYDEAYTTFLKVLEYSEFMNKKGIISVTLDTNAVLLTGAAAQNAEKKVEATKYFRILADAKVSGPENEFLYKYMARDAFDRNDIPAFEKYMAYGKELYPEEEFYSYTEEDFVFSIEDPAEKNKRIEDLLAKDPNNYKVQAVYGESIFEILNPRDLEETLPENWQELEVKMVKAFNKAGELEPKNPASYMNLANHFLNKSIRTNNAIRDLQKAMRDKQRENTPPAVKGKPAPKPPPPDPADVEKRKALTALYEEQIIDAQGYYEKSYDIYAAMEEPKGLDKQNMRNAVNYLIDIYKELKDAAIRDKKTADEAKYAAQEKKFLDVYSKLAR